MVLVPLFWAFYALWGAAFSENYYVMACPGYPRRQLPLSIWVQLWPLTASTSLNQYKWAYNDITLVIGIGTQRRGPESHWGEGEGKREKTYAGKSRDQRGASCLGNAGTCSCRRTKLQKWLMHQEIQKLRKSNSHWCRWKSRRKKSSNCRSWAACGIECCANMLCKGFYMLDPQPVGP